MFDYGARVKDRIPAQVGDLGFAGFRVNSRADWDRDMFAFLGASYFRAVGASKQYGLSARGLAIDTGMERPGGISGFPPVLAGAACGGFHRP
jgi:glucans biosynthesis protein